MAAFWSKNVILTTALLITTGTALGGAVDHSAVYMPSRRDDGDQKKTHLVGILVNRSHPDRGLIMRVYGPDAPNYDPVVTVNPGDNLVFIDWVNVQDCAAHWLKKDDARQNGVVAGLCRALIAARTDGWHAAGRTGDAPDVKP